MAGQKRRPSDKVNRLTMNQSIVFVDVVRAMRPVFEKEKTNAIEATARINAALKRSNAGFEITRSNLMKLLNKEEGSEAPIVEPWDGLRLRQTSVYATRLERERAHARIDQLEEKLAVLEKNLSTAGNAEEMVGLKTQSQGQATKLAELRNQVEGLASLVQLLASEVQRLGNLAKHVPAPAPATPVAANGSHPART